MRRLGGRGEVDEGGRRGRGGGREKRKKEKESDIILETVEVRVVERLRLKGCTSGGKRKEG